MQRIQVECCLASSTQQMISSRDKGVMSFQGIDDHCVGDQPLPHICGQIVHCASQKGPFASLGQQRSLCREFDYSEI